MGHLRVRLCARNSSLEVAPLGPFNADCGPISLTTRGMSGEATGAISHDRVEDGISALGPDERLGIGIVQAAPSGPMITPWALHPAPARSDPTCQFWDPAGRVCRPTAQ